MELSETNQAASEVEKSADDAVIYKAIGTLLVKAEKDKVAVELNERKELLGTRTQVLGKQEERLRTQLKDVQSKLQQDLSPVSQPPS